MPQDSIISLGKACIQHGPQSDRVYLIKLNGEPIEEVAPQLESLARTHGYGKLFTKVPDRAAVWLANRGYTEEARIPGYFRREEDAVFMSLFTDRERADNTQRDQIEAILGRCAFVRKAPLRPLPGDCILRPAREGDAREMAALYGEVFDSYPFPIDRCEYIRQTMRSHVRYFLVRSVTRLVAVASGEMDLPARAAEMTDFATHPSRRGEGLASSLLEAMEEPLACENGIATYFTIARALSESMNRTFARLDYRFAGTLLHNTQIAGRIESMNIWYKRAADRPNTQGSESNSHCSA